MLHQKYMVSSESYKKTRFLWALTTLVSCPRPRFFKGPPILVKNKFSDFCIWLRSHFIVVANLRTISKSSDLGHTLVENQNCGKSEIFLKQILFLEENFLERVVLQNVTNSREAPTTPLSRAKWCPNRCYKKLTKKKKWRKRLSSIEN